MEAVEVSLPLWVRGACRSDDRGTETAEMKASWSDGSLGGCSSAEDGQVVAVTGIPEALGTETPEVPKMVTWIPEAPTTCSGGRRAGWLRAKACAGSTRDWRKGWETDAT